jgi:hypothetical protein
MIITTYRIENISDDHPYIWQAAKLRAGECDPKLPGPRSRHRRCPASKIR